MNRWWSKNHKWTFVPRTNGCMGDLCCRNAFGDLAYADTPFINRATGTVSFGAWTTHPRYVRAAVVKAMGGIGER